MKHWLDVSSQIRLESIHIFNCEGGYFTDAPPIRINSKCFRFQDRGILTNFRGIFCKMQSLLWGILNFSMQVKANFRWPLCKTAPSSPGGYSQLGNPTLHEESKRNSVLGSSIGLTCMSICYKDVKFQVRHATISPAIFTGLNNFIFFLTIHKNLPHLSGKPIVSGSGG